MDADIQSSGLTKNVPNTIDPLVGNNLGFDAHEMPMEGAVGGNVAYVQGPNKEIMNTGYYPKDAWQGLHQFLVKWYTDMGEIDDGIIIEYWRKEEDGTEHVIGQAPDFMVGVSDTFGNGVGNCLFQDNCQYKIKIKSAPVIAPDKYVAVDYITYLQLNPWGTISYHVPASGVPAVENNFHEWVDVPGNGTNTGSVRVDLPIPAAEYYVKPIPIGTGEWAVNYDNADENGFTLYLRNLNGTWTGTSTVDVSIAMYVPALTV